MTYKSGTISYEWRQKVFWIQISLAVVLMAIYVYSVTAITRNVARSEALEHEFASLSVHQSELEFSYIEMRNRIDLSLASRYGLKPLANERYISRAKSISLSLNANR
jgi:hypothetical protein